MLQAPSKFSKKQIAIILPLLIAVVSVFVWYASRPPSSVGTLVVRVSPPAYAALDGGFIGASARPKMLSKHLFSQLEPRTYRLKVWRKGYHEDRRQVSVQRGERTEVTVILEPQ